MRVTSVRNSFCGFIPSLTQQRYGLQARQTSGWDFTLLFDDDSLLGGSRNTHAEPRQDAGCAPRAPGTNRNDIAAPWIPGATGRIPTSAGTILVPRRPGALKVWAVIGGAKTNVLTLRVVPRRGC